MKCQYCIQGQSMQWSLVPPWWMIIGSVIRGDGCSGWLRCGPVRIKFCFEVWFKRHLLRWFIFMLLSCLTNEHGFCWGRHHKWWPWWCSWSALIAHTCKSQVSANQMPRMIHMVILLELATGDRLVPSFQAVVSVFYSSIPCHTSTWHFVAYILETSWNKCIVAIQTKCRIQIETWLEINSFHVDFWEEATIMVNDQFFLLILQWIVAWK